MISPVHKLSPAAGGGMDVFPNLNRKRVRRTYLSIPDRTTTAYLAAYLKLPASLISYILLENAYREAHTPGAQHLPCPPLHKLLQQMKGDYQLLTGFNRLFIQFRDGSTLSSEGATLTWQEFFRHAYIHYTPAQLQRIEMLIDLVLRGQEHLEAGPSAS